VAQKSRAFPEVTVFLGWWERLENKPQPGNGQGIKGCPTPGRRGKKVVSVWEGPKSRGKERYGEPVENKWSTVVGFYRVEEGEKFCG